MYVLKDILFMQKKNQYKKVVTDRSRSGSESDIATPLLQAAGQSPTVL